MIILLTVTALTNTPKTDKQIKQEEEFLRIKKESDKKEKNKIRY